VNHDVNPLKAIQDFVDHLRCAFRGRDIRLDKVVVRLFRRGGTRGYDDDCSTLLETVGNRLACAFVPPVTKARLPANFVCITGNVGCAHGTNSWVIPR